MGREANASPIQRSGAPPGQGRAHFALATLSGVLGFLACSYPWGGALGWFALLPLLWVIDTAPSTARALWLCWWAGLVASFGACQWMIGVLMRFAGFQFLTAVEGHVLFSAYQGLVWLALGVMVRLARARLALPMVAVVPFGLVSGQFLVPYLFPYGLELSQASNPAALQLADLAGRFGVTALLGLCSAVVFDLIGPSRGSRRVAQIGGVVGLVVLCGAWTYGFARLRLLDEQLRSAPVIRVGIVQPHASVGTQPPAPLAAAIQLIRFRQRSVDLAGRGAELVIWPEGSYPGPYPRERQVDYPGSDPRTASAGLTVPLIFGSLTERTRDHALYNSALVFAPGGHLIGRYDKTVLVPFGEYIPRLLNLPWMRQLSLGTGPGLQAGEAGASPIAVDLREGSQHVRLGLLICYEDLLPGATRLSGDQHPDLLLNLSNDAWFDSKQETWMHLAAAVYAAVEQRTSLVRAVNPGGSALIEPTGRIRFQTPLTHVGDPSATPESALITVPLRSAGYTIYARTAQIFPLSCLLVNVLTLTGAWFRGQRAGKLGKYTA